MSKLDQWESLIQSSAKEVGLDPNLLRAVMKQESGGNPQVVSHAGAIGLMQLMPDTARELGVDPRDPVQNVRGGARYLKDRIDEFGGDVTLGVSAYNTGAGNVRKALARGGLSHLHPETKGYIKNILGVDAENGAPAKHRAINVPQYFSNEAISDRGKQIEAYKAQQEEANQRYDSLSTIAKAAMEEDHFIPSLMSGYDRLQLSDDPNWVRPDVETVANDLEQAGLGNQFLPRAMEMKSKAQYDLFLEQAADEVKRNQLMAQNGWRGTLTRLAVGMADPVSIGVGLATGGIGYGAKLGRVGYAATQGTINAGINAAMEEVQVGLKETKTQDDVLMAMAGGFVLGGALSAPMYRSVLGDEMADQIIKRSAVATHTLRNDLTLINEIDLAKQAGDHAKADALIQQLTPENQSKYMTGTAGAAQADRVEHAIFDPKNVKQSIQDKIDDIESGIFQDVLDEHTQRTAVGKGIDWFVGKLRHDAAGNLLERNESWAKLLGRIGENGIGVDSSGRGTGFSGEEIGRLLRRTQEVAWLRDIDEAFENFDRQAGNSFRGHYVRRKEFLNDVIDATEGLIEVTDPHKLKAVNATRKFFKKYEQEGLDSGVLEKVSDRGGNYVPHIIDYGKVRQLADEYTPDDLSKLTYESMKKAHLPKLTEFLDELDAKIKDLEVNVKKVDGEINTKDIAELERLKAYREKYPKALDKLQMAVAKGYTNNILKRGVVGKNSHMFGAIKLDDAADLRVKLKDAGISDQEIEEIIQSMSIHDPKGGSTGRAKPRVEFDMSHAITVHSKHDGTAKMLSMRDLMARDLDYIIPMYGRQMSGRIGIAKATGIKNDSEFATALENMRIEAGPKEIQTFAFKKAENDAKFLYNAVVGNPLDADPSHWTHKPGQRLRDLNYLVRGPGFVFAQIAEIGNVLGGIGLKAAFKQMPILADIRTAFKGSRPDNVFLRQLDAVTAIGTNRIMNQMFTSIDDYGFRLSGKVDKAFHSAKNAVADYSGFNFIQTMEQRMAAAGMAQRLVDIAKEVKGDITKLKPAQLRELKSIGFHTDDELSNVFKHLIDKDKTKVTKSWGKVYEFNEDAWDAGAFNTMTLALQKAAHRFVQENSFGTSIPFMHQNIGKVLFQFRSFAMNAVVKQTLQAMSQRDTATLMKVMYGLIFGSLSYMGQTAATKYGTEKFEEAMEPDKIALAATSRMGMSSLIPAAIDSSISAISGGTVNGLWSHARSSGLGSGVLEGNPSYKTATSLGRIVTGTPQVLFNDDYDFSKDDLAAWADITPGAGLAPFKLAINTMMEDLPRKSFDKAIDVQDYFK